MEFLGYAGRVWSLQDIGSSSAYIMQSICLTIGPSFLMAGIYYVIVQLTLIYGEEFSILKPMQYSLIVIVADVFSIFLQAAGGGIAAQGNQTGIRIMVVGLSIQLVTIAIFQAFWYHFLWNIHNSYKLYQESKFNAAFKFVRDRNLLVPFMIAISISVIFNFC